MNVPAAIAAAKARNKKAIKRVENRNEAIFFSMRVDFVLKVMQKYGKMLVSVLKSTGFILLL
jgi:hypothetical protein